MVTEIQAFRDSAGIIHETKLAAARADAEIKLGKILGDNRAALIALLENAVEVVNALVPYATEQEGLPQTNVRQLRQS